MNTELFFDKLIKSGIEFFTGVPDSLLKDLGNCIYEKLSDTQHVIAANEGNAVALAAGSYIATGKIPLVYLQNSGLGNTINPLLSMADKKLYAIPMVIFVGWRGEDGVHDAEQHLVQGPATLKIIEGIEYPYIILEKDDNTAYEQIDKVLELLRTNPQPYFVVVRKSTFDKYPLTKKPAPASTMSREHALREIAEALPEECFVVTTTGKTSREWFEVREQCEQPHTKDFLTVGSMGHTSSIALGMALRSEKQVVCIDGDGSMLMHMGALVVATKYRRNNFRYIMINNFSHESVGGLPTPLLHINFERFFTALGFEQYFYADDEKSLHTSIQAFLASTRSVLEVRVAQGARDGLSRPHKSAGELTHMLRKEFNQ